MNNYIYNNNRIKDSMMFHNKELSNGDIVWGYEPRGKKLYHTTCGNWYEHMKIYDHEIGLGEIVDWGCELAKDDDTRIDYEAKLGCTCHEGTGKVIVKYKVVEVEKRYYKEGGDGYGSYTPPNRFINYGYKLEKISDVSMELSEFYVASKYEWAMKSFEGQDGCKHMSYHDNLIITCDNIKSSAYRQRCLDGKVMDIEKIPCLLLTRYNGLTQVILRSEKE